jgi:ATP-binding cassette subfamily F protein 3
MAGGIPASYKGALVVVSHDRYFLDKLCSKIWEVSSLRFTSYKGNYTKYTRTREMMYERQLKEYEMQQQNVAKLTDYIARNKMRASTAAMARSREKALERMTVVKQPPKPLYPARMAFRFEAEPVKEVLHVEGLSLRVGEGSEQKQLCSGVDFDLLRGEKVALVGR